MIVMSSEQIKKNVEKALDEIRPFLESDGGNINLLLLKMTLLLKFNS